VEVALARQSGVHWSEVNAATGRVVVSFDDDHTDVGRLVEVIEAVEAANGLADERFPHDRPEHPADVEPLRRQLLAVGANVAGLGLSLVGRLVRANPLLGEAASVVSLVEATPALRRPLETWLGPAVADVSLAAGSAVSQGLAQGPLGLVIDIAHRWLRIDELDARRELWLRREPELSGEPGKGQVRAWSATARPARLPAGPVESYSGMAAAGALVGAAVTAAATRDPQLIVAATAVGNPKPARLGREAFAARLDRDLARSGVLAMDADALRRLDRVDTIVVDAHVLTGAGRAVRSVWLRPGERDAGERALLAASALVSSAVSGDGKPAGARPRSADRPELVAEDGEWAVGRLPGEMPGQFQAAARELHMLAPGLLALWRDHDLVGLVVTEPEPDPLAGPLMAAARQAGQVVMAGRSPAAVHADSDRVVAGGARTVRSVRTLQAGGAVVAVVSDRQHEALAAADVGIGELAGPVPPWGAHLITGPGLAGACRVLQAVPTARASSRRATRLAAYGSGTGAVLALTGPRPDAAIRSMLAVNVAALASLSSGFWSALTLARRPEPVPAGRTLWHALASGRVLRKLESSCDGLTREQASIRDASRTDSRTQAGTSVLQASAEELANPLTPALACGAGLAAVAGSVTDAVMIGSFMAANALASGIQRARVDHALRSLIDESAVRVRLRRAGEETLTTADRLVPGDVVLVQAGDAVPADCRILEAHGLEADESSLTGESLLVVKDEAPTTAAQIADRTSMLYAGSSIAAGTATAVAVAVGEATELGRSTKASQGGRRPRGVHARLAQLTRETVPLALGAGAAVIGGGVLRGRPVRDVLGTGVSLAVAAVPESLPIIATAAQYSAARRLSRRNALVRNPGSIEALGRVDVLCFDKTGTLTRGKIRLHRIWTPNGEQPLGELAADGKAALAIGLRATPQRHNGEPLPHATDRAIVKGGIKAGVHDRLGAPRWRQVGELPFEPSRGYHAVLGRTADGMRLCAKGAPEVVLPRCVRLRSGHGTVDLDDRTRTRIVEEADRLAHLGYRVLAAADRDVAARQSIKDAQVSRLCFAGLLALTDPVRDTAAQAIRGLRAAQVEVMMLTGDHPSTAEAIAAEIGLLNDHRVITGRELDAASDLELHCLVQKAAVFARVSPEHKVRIVAALRRAGRIVAVTGDGANDAPAIKLADVGVALGRRSTNAAKDAADVIVTDNRIETVIDAIAEGRAMWSSVRDAIAVLLGGNLGEIAFTLGAGLLLPSGSPLNARQLLLVNLLTDMVPSLALAVQAPTSAAPDVLLREGPDVSLGKALARDILTRGGLTAAGGLAAWIGGRMTGMSRRRASTVGLVGIVGAQLGQTLVSGWRSPLVVSASLGSAAALAAVIQTPGVSRFFGCTPLGPVGWGVGLGAAAGAAAGAPLAARLAARIGLTRTAERPIHEAVMPR
jgi:cation-transporting ATPase I